MCFVWISEQTAIISLYCINWLVCITDTECLLRGTDWVFTYNVCVLYWSDNKQRLFPCTALTGWVFSRVGKIAKKLLLVSSCPSVCPHVTTRLALDRFSWNLMFEYFSKISWESSSLITIWQGWRALYMETYYIYDITWNTTGCPLPKLLLLILLLLYWCLDRTSIKENWIIINITVIIHPSPPPTVSPSDMFWSHYYPTQQRQQWRQWVTTVRQTELSLSS